MDNTGSVSGAPQGTSIYSGRTGAVAAKPNDDLGKDDFMKLLLAQLQHQDPMNPMDDQAFIAQVAQFNTLDQMTSMNKTLAAVLDSQQISEASNLIGKVVSAAGPESTIVTGMVTAASIEAGVAKLHIDGKKVNLEDVTAVSSDVDSMPSTEEASA